MFEALRGHLLGTIKKGTLKTSPFLSLHCENYQLHSHGEHAHGEHLQPSIPDALTVYVPSNAATTTTKLIAKYFMTFPPFLTFF